MYRTNEILNGGSGAEREGILRGVKKKVFSVDGLLNLTETIATMAMAAGFLLLIAALLASC